MKEGNQWLIEEWERDWLVIHEWHTLLASTSESELFISTF